MKYVSTCMALAMLTGLSGCNWFGGNSNPPYNVSHDFEVHCKWRPGTPRNKVSASQVWLKIDPNKQGNGQEWDEFKIEVQEKVSTQGGSSWQTIAQTAWLNYPQALSSVTEYTSLGNGNWSGAPSPPVYLPDLSSKVSPGGKLVNGGGFNSAFTYRLVLKGKWNNSGTPFVSSQTTEQIIQANMIHACKAIPQIERVKADGL